MSRKIVPLPLPWIASLALFVLGLSARALADAGGMQAGLQSGGISGAFFSGNPMTLPAAQGVSPSAPPGPDLCGSAAALAAANHHLPPGLLEAIAKVESGRPDGEPGVLLPWPWTIDADGVGYVYASAQAAAQAAAGFQAAGVTSLDVGCLQVNLAQHPEAFHDLAQAFDPDANADFAARFLVSLEQKFRNWPQAVAAYHSQTPDLGGPYAVRVYAQWQSGPTAAMALTGTPDAGALLPGPPPPTAFAISTLLPPMRVMQHSGPAGTGRDLASYRAAPVAIASLAPAG